MRKWVLINIVLIFLMVFSCKEKVLNDRDIVKLLYDRLHKPDSSITRDVGLDTVFNETGHLIYLRINYEGVIDSLPDEFYQLNYIEKLNLEFLNIRKIKSLNHMSNLKDINLGTNALSDTFSFKILPKNIKIIFLGNNNISYFKDCDYLENLQWIAICNNLHDQNLYFKNIAKDSCLGCYKGYTPPHIKKKGIECQSRIDE